MRLRLAAPSVAAKRRSQKAGRIAMAGPPELLHGLWDGAAWFWAAQGTVETKPNRHGLDRQYVTVLGPHAKKTQDFSGAVAEKSHVLSAAASTDLPQLSGKPFLGEGQFDTCFDC